jgi:hypothetical protein
VRPDGVETLEVGYFAEADLAGLKLPAWAGVVLPNAFSERKRTDFEGATWQPPQGSRIKLRGRSALGPLVGMLMA